MVNVVYDFPSFVSDQTRHLIDDNPEASRRKWIIKQAREFAQTGEAVTSEGSARLLRQLGEIANGRYWNFKRHDNYLQGLILTEGANDYLGVVDELYTARIYNQSYIDALTEDLSSSVMIELGGLIVSHWQKQGGSNNG